MEGEIAKDPALTTAADGEAAKDDMIRGDSVRADLTEWNTDQESNRAAEVIERARHAARQIGSRAAHGVEVSMHGLKDPDTRRKVATTVGAGAAMVVSGVGAVVGTRKAHARRQPPPAQANFYGKIRGMVTDKLK